MIPLYNNIDFTTAKAETQLPCSCEECGKIFYKPKKFIVALLKGTYKNKVRYCSSGCRINKSKTSLLLNCSCCNKSFYKTPYQIKKSKSGKHFCSQSCAATYNHQHKSYAFKRSGQKRSKLELYLETKLINLYPNLNFHFNRKDAINSELDIYVPSLKLAFELNGIFHYEPIYGEKKLQQTKNNDERKFQACLEKQIEFCTIDTSTFKNFKEHKAQKYLHIISNIINAKTKALYS